MKYKILKIEAKNPSKALTPLMPHRQKGQPSALWYPFTQMQEWEQGAPTVIVEGRGSYFTDQTGKRYLDGTSSLWVNLHGHRKKAIDDAIIKEMRKMSHSTLLGLSHPLAITLAEQLIRIAPPGLTKVFYSDNGSTAVEVAIKMAFAFWQHQGQKEKRQFMSFSNAYHGDTLGSVSVGGIDLFHSLYKPLLFKNIPVQAPYCYRCPWGKTYPSCQMVCVDAVERVMKRRHRRIAGLVIEPLVQAAAGICVAPPGYLKRIRELCTKYNILMIADEVATGFGRTGKMFACEHEGVSPDLMAVAKGITGGYLPLAATLTTQKIYDAFLGSYDTFKTFFHGHSYTGNRLGCAAALASLSVFREEGVLEKLQPKVAFLTKYLAGSKGNRHIGDIRQVGFMVGIELVRDEGEPYPLSERVGAAVCMEAKAHGVWLRPLGNVIVLMPPLSISMRDLKKLTDTVFRAIETVTMLASPQSSV